ncbi:hypothetical protein P175DRAFT_0507645 [Aspergillus ochraceoroseus IBT 24754]|uniref:Uncharacterized protein n=3 Tax=Aspergillus subgen. Nidulantes TaxID=2720870 RepID=A0A0F8UW53_9EURO|nr:uncharacterized protein P175DRAFT_0507645 [Aspergillus ochraceoroseus IBT 24754]KKK13921.1 hypothetical protein AOCH_002839 [Aspergillus ochraceoroseus]KKK23704.1 hypothetical protein ARAM_005744 [Aspergillus rambellii]PTU22875.1 hypothetical protein P175DRAFT_0507645 [Aspergillus ochraceoroseus IBT 24754]
MDSDYPPLPSTTGINASLHSLSLSDGENAAQFSSGSETLILTTHGEQVPVPGVQVIAETGDVILRYDSSEKSPLGKSETATYRWKVSSSALMRNSAYYRALLDPTKFSEGREFRKQKELCGFSTDLEVAGMATTYTDDAGEYPLPTICLPGNQFSPRLGVDAIELFLRTLSFDSSDEDEHRGFDAEIKAQRTAVIAGVVELADIFNSPQIVRDTLKRSGYSLGKPKTRLTKFSSSMLTLTEDRIRQSIFIAGFLEDKVAFQMLTHTLIVAGSRNWVNGLESPDPDAPRWHYFSDGLEEELYYRRQCVLNTITDLQAYFLRMYGALEEPPGPQTTPLNPSTAASVIRSRQYQCRCGLGNSSACDAFHLGQMTRFFTLRTKTIFIGSTLIDPDFNPDAIWESEDADATEQVEFNLIARPSTDLTAIISSLKQCPDYQIDANHTSCGIRRRFLPTLDCIEGFVGDDRGLLGVNLQYWKGGKWPVVMGSWGNRSLRRALVMDIRLSRISGIPLMSRGTFGAESREEDARLLFTAKKRNWEA